MIILKSESELAVKWFRENNIVNPDKFQAMVLQKQDKNSQIHSLNRENKIIEKANLRFDEPISNLCNKAFM